MDEHNYAAETVFDIITLVLVLV